MFKPRFKGEYPTLGFEVLDWTSAYLPSPRDEREPLVFVPWQQERILRYYELDPTTGRRLYNRCHDEDAKGMGKSPLAAAVALAEYCGPVLFDGWDSHGRPVGRPYGSGGSPPPWVQVAATSEDQTRNTWMALYGFLLANGGKAADELRVSVGRTQIYHRDMPSAYMERVTSSAAAREGQPVTHAVLDEPQLWTHTNGGTDLAGVILRNLTKMNGWAHFTGNAPVLGMGSVAELMRDPAPGALHMGRRASQEPEEDWPEERLRALLAEVYEGVPWVDIDRALADVQDRGQMAWADAKRFFFNLPADAPRDDAWVEPDEWDACEGDAPPSPAEPTYVRVQVGRDYQVVAVALAQRKGDGAVLRCRIFEAPEGEVLDLADVEEHVLSLREEYPAKVVSAVQARPGGKVAHVVRPGPEVSYHGAFFQRSRQLLEKAGVVLLQQPDTATYLAPAAAHLRGLLTERKLSHDGDPDLSRHVSAVAVKETQAGPMPRLSSDPQRRIEAAVAAMHAVSRAMTAPRPAQTKPTFRSM